MFTWSLESAVSDVRAVVRYALSLTLAPLLDAVYPPPEVWDWRPDGSEELNETEAECEVAEPMADWEVRLLATERPTSELLHDGATAIAWWVDGKPVPAYPLHIRDRWRVSQVELRDRAIELESAAAGQSDDDFAAAWRAGTLRVVGCDACESSADVAENGPGEMCDAEPSPRPAGQGASFPPTSPAQHPKLAQWLEPAVLEVLANHNWAWHCKRIECWPDDGDTSCGWFEDAHEWREHVAELIAAHVAAALADYPGDKPAVETGMDMGGKAFSAEMFPQWKGNR